MVDELFLIGWKLLVCFWQNILAIYCNKRTFFTYISRCSSSYWNASHNNQVQFSPITLLEHPYPQCTDTLYNHLRKEYPLSRTRTSIHNKEKNLNYFFTRGEGKRMGSWKSLWQTWLEAWFARCFRKYSPRPNGTHKHKNQSSLESRMVWSSSGVDSYFVWMDP